MFINLFGVDKVFNELYTNFSVKCAVKMKIC